MWKSLLALLNKFIPNRKAAAVDQLNALNVKYANALEDGRDTEAAVLKKQMGQLRKKLGITDGDI